jgi:hypothetical protein
MSIKNKINRSIIPIRDQKYVGFTTYDAKDPDQISAHRAIASAESRACLFEYGA